MTNPPFERGADIEHIRHACAKLAPRSRLVAIFANGHWQREELGEVWTEWIDLPPISFKHSGTNTSTAVVVVVVGRDPSLSLTRRVTGLVASLVINGSNA